MWFVSSSVDFFPDLKGRGIRLAISMNPQLEREREAETPFTFDDLPADHPAKEFAASVTDDRS